MTDLNPTTVIELLSNLDWFAFPFVILTLLPAVILAVNKVITSIGIEITSKRALYGVLIALYLGALLSIKVGATIEDNYKVKYIKVTRCFDAAKLTSLTFNEVRAKSGITFSDEDLKDLTVKFSTIFSLDAGNGPDSLKLVYVDPAGVEKIYRALRSPAVGYIKQYLDAWRGLDRANITFKNLRSNDPRFTYEFSEWLAGQSDLDADNLKLKVSPSPDFGERFGFEYK